MRILFAIIANAVALFATTVVPGITFHGDVLTLLVAGAVLGLFNLVVRPLAVLLSLPLLVVTLGLFFFILNGALLLLASWFLPGYHVGGLLSGIIGAVVMSVVNWALHALFRTEKKED